MPRAKKARHSVQDSSSSSSSSSFDADNGGEAPGRRRAQREVAERRAAHFARADEHDRLSLVKKSTSLRNSTPTGSFVSRGAKAGEDDAWCGPFATAHQIMNRREEAKRIREVLVLPKHVIDSVYLFKIYSFYIYRKH